MAIGNKLKQLLEERGITVKDFAQKIGVPPTTLYSFIKRDSSNAKMELLLKICEGLDVSITEFLTTQEEINGEETDVLDLTVLGTNEQIGYALTELIKNPSTKFINPHTGEIETLHNQLGSIAQNGLDLLEKQKEITLKSAHFAVQAGKNLLESFEKLNEKGQEKALEQVELLTKIPEYRKDQD